MDEAWRLLEEVGLPDGALRRVEGPFRDGDVRRAVDELAARVDMLGERERELLLAWLRGFRHHWPDRFASCLDGVGEELLGALERRPYDDNRYLKLRRIAIANLAELI